MRSQINFNHLECFLTVARTQSFSRTALELKIAQPAVSKQIRTLEESLGVDLFVRNRKAILLTEAGKDLFNRTAGLYKTICEEVTGVREARQELSGTIRIGCLGEVGERIFLGPLSEFKLAHPQVAMNINFLKAHEIIEKLKAGELDLGITPEKVMLENIRSYEIFREEIILVSNQKALTDKLTELPFIAYRENDPLLSFYLKKVSSKVNLSKLNIQLTVNSHRSMARLLTEHPFYAVLPRLSVQEELREKRLFQVGNKTLESKLYLMVRETTVADRKVDLLRSWITQKLR